MEYAEVAVDAPIGYDKTLSYSIPPRLDVEPGQMVWIPVGPRPVQGIVFHLADRPQVEVVKDIIATVEPSPLISSIGLELSRWISRYYLAPLFDSVSLMLPPGFQSSVRSYIRSDSQGGTASSALTPLEEETLDQVRIRGEVRETELLKALGSAGESEIRRLTRRGLLKRRWELPRPRMSHRYERYLRLPLIGEGVEDVLAERAPRQRALYEALASSDGSIPLSRAHKEYGAGAVAGLLRKRLLALEWRRADREPALQKEKEESDEAPFELTPAQERALARVTAALESVGTTKRTYLLHGVTGSGKTEVYLQALQHCVRSGRKGILLVPEIALTPQTVHRLNARFPGRVAVLHSRLSIGEQFDQWWRIKDGDYDVVVGPRSALFAPLHDLGLIVIDEEHEWTYKQQDASPHYHAREVALKFASLAGAVVVMGTATPDVESYYRAKRGDYGLLELPQRVSSAGSPRREPSQLASVEVCDMRRELKEGNRSIFSRALTSGLSECVERGQQAILFLNRRGAATVVQCRECGHVMRCRRCSVALTYHAAETRLVCHHCNGRSAVPGSCPQCRSPHIRYLGQGTQRVQDELKHLLPHVTALRWDRDTARAGQAHQSIMRRFLAKEAEVLIGTQMVAKGLHVPDVSLVGVILADVGLNLPDFRAGERAFQLLCQVAGRAGRGEAPGRVIIQTYSPTNYAVKAAAAQDYGLLYTQEIRFRQQQGDPPFNRLIHMTYLHTNADACQEQAEKMGRTLRRRAYSQGSGEVEVIGPAPATPERVRGRYRWHLILRGRNLHSFLDGVVTPQGWTVDVDPVTVL